MDDEEDDLFLPVLDVCMVNSCGLAKATHEILWSDGGPGHEFKAAAPHPRPDRVASSFILTSWTCTRCGEPCDVWGVADMEWMECEKCGRQSFVMSFANQDPTP